MLASRSAVPRSGTSAIRMPSGRPAVPSVPGGTMACGEAEPVGLDQPAADAGDRPDLAGQPDLAERDGARRRAARSTVALATASATARSLAGSVSRTPPTVAT